MFNETCDCFVIPLADAFRQTFVPELKGLTETVRALKIPCYVIGVGLKAPIGVTDFDFSYNDDVKDFVNAVLEKSAMIGVRGHITGDYLGKLGFTPEKDFTVIGCPSMYMKKQLSIREPDISKDSDIAYNISPEADALTMRYIRRNAKAFHSAVYIPQNVHDLKLVYAGITRNAGIAQDSLEDFPRKPEDPSLDEAVFPGSVETWRRLLQTKNLSFGTRLHGNIMGVLAGIPTIHIPFDARTSELVAYHGLVCAERKDIEAGVSILDLAERLDFQKPVRVQKRNFEHYMAFLDANGIKHIDPAAEEAPLDRVIREMTFPEPLKSIRCAEREEVLTRAITYSNYADQNIKTLKDQVKKEKKAGSLKKAKQQIAQQEEMLMQKEEEIRSLTEENEKLRQEGTLNHWKRKHGRT